MKRQTLTKQNIQVELMQKLNKQKNATVYLTILLCVYALCYVAYVICYANGIDIGTGRFSSVTPVAAIIILPFLMLPIAMFVFGYYSKLYKIKAGKFEIVEEKLCGKAEEWRSYYRRTVREKILYFKRGEISVSSDVYSYANVGDAFYLAVINNGRPLMAYSKKHYEMEKE